MSGGPVGLPLLAIDGAGARTGKEYRFHIAEDVLRAGRAAAEPIDVGGIASLYEGVTRVALYVHVPWCVETCTYCYYWGKVEGRSAMRALLEAEETHSRLLDDIIRLREMAVSSIYFGGGTPTVLPADLLERAMESFVGKYSSNETREVCSEASVSSLTEEKIAVLKRYVTRLSIGVQSFDDHLLGSVARSFTSEQAQRLLRRVVPEFPLVNIDLIFGLAGQTLDSWKRTVETAVEIGVTSITLYRLEVRVPAQIADFERNPSAYPGDGQCMEMRQVARQFLLGAGYRENLVGWFVKPREADTVVYRERWQKQTPCVAFGPGVQNYGAGYFYYNTKENQEYEAVVREGRLPIDAFFRLPPAEQGLWYCLAQLKSNTPISFDDVRARFGSGPANKILGGFEPFSKRGLLVASATEYKLSEAGSAVLEWMISDLLKPGALQPRADG